MSARTTDLVWALNTTKHPVTTVRIPNTINESADPFAPGAIKVVVPRALPLKSLWWGTRFPLPYAGLLEPVDQGKSVFVLGPHLYRSLRCPVDGTTRGRLTAHANLEELHAGRGARGTVTIEWSGWEALQLLTGHKDPEEFAKRWIPALYPGLYAVSKGKFSQSKSRSRIVGKFDVETAESVFSSELAIQHTQPGAMSLFLTQRSRKTDLLLRDGLYVDLSMRLQLHKEGAGAHRQHVSTAAKKGTVRCQRRHINRTKVEAHCKTNIPSGTIPSGEWSEFQDALGAISTRQRFTLFGP